MHFTSAENVRHFANNKRVVRSTRDIDNRRVCWGQMSPLKHVLDCFCRSLVCFHKPQFWYFVDECMYACAMIHQHLELLIALAELHKRRICHKNKILYRI